jgi:hypothetical protein
MNMARKHTKPACPRCRRGKESFWYLGLYEYDVDHALALVGDGREAVEVDEESVRQSVADSVIDEGHLPHVDPVIPGVIAHVQYQTDAGEMLHGHVLIDGHHRAARCLREGQPFLARILTEQESQEVLIRNFEDPFPPTKAPPIQSENGYQITHPRTGASCSLTEEEYFLFGQFNGRNNARDVQSAFQRRFQQPLLRERLNVFVMWAQDRGFLQFTADLAAHAAR